MTSSLVQRDLCLLQVNPPTDNICMGTTEPDRTMQRTVPGPSSWVVDENADASCRDHDAASVQRTDHPAASDMAGGDIGWIHRNIALVGGSRLPLATI